jgi:hypothetical protein
MGWMFVVPTAAYLLLHRREMRCLHDQKYSGD